MTEQRARELAERAVSTAAPDDPQIVADTTVLLLNLDGTYSVCDNGEEAVATTAEQAIEFIVENLTN